MAGGGSVSDYMGIEASILRGRMVKNTFIKTRDDFLKNAAIVRGQIEKSNLASTMGAHNMVLSSIVKFKGAMNDALGRAVDSEIVKFESEIQRLAKSAGGVHKIDKR